MLILPAIDIRGGRCVRLLQGDYSKETVYSDSPVDQALKWRDEGARILHIVDLDGAKEGRPVNLEVFRKICAAIDIPCELGGGIRTEADAEKALEAGAARVILGTSVCERPELAAGFVRKFGGEKIVAGIDAKNGRAAVRGWIETTPLDALGLAAELCAGGIGRIIYTDISTDGMLSGPNLAATRTMCEKVPGCKIIASGGVGSEKDVAALAALGLENLEGAIVGKALYDGRVSLKNLLSVTAARCP